MARQRVVLQPPRSIAAGDTQLNEDAARVGQNRKGVVFADVYSGGGSSFVLRIDTCSDLDSTAGGLASWIEIASKTLTGTGSFSLVIDELGDAIRWRATGTGSGTVGIVAFLTDKG